MTLKLEQARKIIATAMKKGAELKVKPLTVAVLDSGGAVVRAGAFRRIKPHAPGSRDRKANGAIALGMGSRAIFRRAQEQPFFIQSMNTLAGGALVPVPGGVLIRGESGEILGAVGYTATLPTMTRPARSPGSRRSA